MDREHTGNGELDASKTAEADSLGSGAEVSEARPPVAPAQVPDTVEGLRAEVERLAGEAERNWQQFLRAAADLENYRKQAVRQREEAVLTTRRALLRVILGVVDTLERALAHAGGLGDGKPEGNAGAIVEGIRLAHRQVLDVLRTMDVRPIDAVGQPFDPRVHEAVEGVPAGDREAPGTVVGEVQRGYLLGDDVLRPARVRVAQ